MLEPKSPEAQEEKDIINLIIAASSDGHVNITTDKHYNVKRLLDRYVAQEREKAVDEYHAKLNDEGLGEDDFDWSDNQGTWLISNETMRDFVASFLKKSRRL